MQFALAVPDEMSISHMALSRDGSMLVFVSPEENSALPMLYVQRIGSSSVTLLPGTQGASYPFWSPDGAYVGFFANGKLQKIAISGGTPQVLATALAGRGGSWGSKGVIIYSPGRRRVRSSASMPMARGWRRSPRASGPKRINPTAGPCFFPTAIISCSGRATLRNCKDDQSSGIYVSSLEGKERKTGCPLPFEFRLRRPQFVLCG